jgi:hypothetical protein
MTERPEDRSRRSRFPRLIRTFAAVVFFGGLTAAFVLADRDRAATPGPGSAVGSPRDGLAPSPHLEPTPEQIFSGVR